MSQEQGLRMTTPRLIVRDPLESDRTALQAIFSVTEIHRYERPVPTSGEVQLMLQQAIEYTATSPRMRYKLVIENRQEGTLCGTISLTLNNSAIREWEIGWLIRREDWGKGIAPEAAAAVLKYAFEELDSHRVVAFCHAENRQSVRVMEKIGMQREGRLRKTRWLNEAWHDEYVYAILEED